MRDSLKPDPHSLINVQEVTVPGSESIDPDVNPAPQIEPDPVLAGDVSLNGAELEFERIQPLALFWSLEQYLYEHAICRAP
ncbi:hypothetical protein [Pseudarthrobacter sulfonivorans]|uniref:hypothetical protein n=1 Tax=Pseudarthrobacter sulfonivorans TaxID=121292 RepID=UPI00285A426D|nr:hypothetical protein [Pseudarthrobacter sulfonivorans]MDR6417633.1 hypothetical protein [Pseudarthrobacter sulfonivorans]